MKAKISWILTMISLILTTAALPFLPERMPMHYDFAGNVDRYGTKYEMFLFPGMLVFFSLLWEFLMRRMLKTDGSEKQLAEQQNNAAIFLIVICMAGLSLLIMQAVQLFNAFSGEAADKMPEWFSSVICGVLGVLMIVLGNLMPKAKRNSMFGLRISWTLKNDLVWQKSNRFAGFAMVICGVLSVVSALFLRGMIVVWLTLWLLVMTTIISLIVSYSIAQKLEYEQK